MDTDDNVKDLLIYLAQALVVNREGVQVSESEEDGATVFTLRVAQDDMGRVIGKGGRTAKAIRSLVAAAATRSNRHVVVQIVE